MQRCISHERKTNRVGRVVKTLSIRCSAVWRAWNRKAEKWTFDLLRMQKQMIATLQKSEGSLWCAQGFHFDGLGVKKMF